MAAVGAVAGRPGGACGRNIGRTANNIRFETEDRVVSAEDGLQDGLLAQW